MKYGQVYLIDILGRIRDISSRKILDSATRKRRQKRQLDALEKDNFQDDPHSHLTVVPAKMKVPAFNDTMEGIYYEYGAFLCSKPNWYCAVPEKNNLCTPQVRSLKIFLGFVGVSKVEKVKKKCIYYKSWQKWNSWMGLEGGS